MFECDEMARKVLPRETDLFFVFVSCNCLVEGMMVARIFRRNRW